ncbi:hypothetical protein AB4383_17935 [Vibrio breoganii]
MKRIALASLVLALTACGSSGSSGDDSGSNGDNDTNTGSHCSDNNEYGYYSGSDAYVFSVNECNDLRTVDFYRKNGRIDSITMKDTTKIVYSHGYTSLNPHSLEAGEIYSFEWETEDGYIDFNWDENSQCYLEYSSKYTDKPLYECNDSDLVKNLKEYFHYDIVAYEYSEAMKNATRTR